MKTYLVTWAIDIDANSPEEAALEAYAIQRDPKSVATVFEVAADHGSGESTTVDTENGIAKVVS